MTELTLEILGKSYRIRCPQEQVDSLQQSAECLEQQMRDITRNHRTSPEKAAVMAALNLTHDLRLAKQTIQQQITTLKAVAS